MKQTVRLIALVAAVSFFLFGMVTKTLTVSQASPSEQLPTDLVFTGRGTTIGNEVSTLALLDAKTLEVIPFYSDETALILRAISWSPQGDLLAVLHIFSNEGDSNYPTQICIIAVEGGGRTCLEDAPPVYKSIAPSLIDYNYHVTWSQNGKNVYFVTESKDQQMRRLVEADASTGKTLRTIHEFAAINGDGIPTIIAWTPDLKYVAVGIQFHERSGTLINLETHEEYDFSEVVKPWLFGAAIEEQPGLGFFCSDFSPNGTYLTAIDEDKSRILIVDKELNVIDTVKNLAAEDQIKIFCPEWDKNENAIFFLVFNLEDTIGDVYKYSLEDHQLVPLFHDAVYPPIGFSPDRDYIAFELVHPFSSKIHVVYPDGTIRLFGEPFAQARYPLWRP